jgi:PAS domain S-box-containing protein
MKQEKERGTQRIEPDVCRTGPEKKSRSELDFTQIMSTIGQGILVTGDGWIFEYVNPAFARIVDRPVEDLTAKSMTDFVIPEDLPILAQERSKRIAGETSTYDIRLRRPNGEIVYVHATGVPRILGGKVIGSILVVTDLTERKNADTALKESESRFHSVINNLFAFVAILDPDGTVKDCNSTALEAANLVHEDVISKPFKDC